MTKKVILITGTPCTGKTTVAKQLAPKVQAQYVNLTELATREKLTLGEDKKRNTVIVDETRMKRKLRQIIETSKENNIVIDGHYAASVVPPELVSYVFVLRRNPVELHEFMRKCKFPEVKMWENLAAEILDVCLVEALNAQKEGKVCELNVSGKSAEEAVKSILDVMSGKQVCCVGIVDWLGKLESEGALDEYLKI